MRDSRGGKERGSLYKILNPHLIGREKDLHGWIEQLYKDNDRYLFQLHLVGWSDTEDEQPICCRVAKIWAYRCNYCNCEQLAAVIKLWSFRVLEQLYINFGSKSELHGMQ